MLVIANDASVTVIDGRAMSLPAGQEIDLPDDRAKQLVKAGVVRAVEPEPEQVEQPEKSETSEQPEKSTPPAAKRRGAAPENKQQA